MEWEKEATVQSSLMGGQESLLMWLKLPYDLAKESNKIEKQKVEENISLVGDEKRTKIPRYCCSLIFIHML